ncbi:MAG: hypothetical protein E6713_06005 [Sporomusaceae bacterium]|nr:hypothetical protein [Sporomusaceae bacterium]
MKKLTEKYLSRLAKARRAEEAGYHKARSFHISTGNDPNFVQLQYFVKRLQSYKKPYFHGIRLYLIELLEKQRQSEAVRNETA